MTGNGQPGTRAIFLAGHSQNNLPEIFWIEGLGLQVIMINPKTQTIVVRLGGIPTGLNLKSNRSDPSIIAPLLKTLIE